jgi:hypothetical protein
MIEVPTLLMAASLLQQSPPVQVRGRDYTTVADSTEVMSGVCDGRAVSATITKAFRGREGRMILRAGRVSQAIPPTFLGGRLLRSSYYAAGLGCDGRRLVLRARVARIEAGGRVEIEVQSATMDMRSGQLTISERRTLSPDEVENELR